MNKLVCGALLALLMLPRAGALSAQAAIVIDADTGAVLQEQNADACLPMASTTKIMTALVALGEVPNEKNALILRLNECRD